MLAFEKLDTNDKAQVKEFVQFHYDLYRGTPQWVPPFYSDIKIMLDKAKHPFYEHSEAEFFIAKRAGKVVGRLAVMENKPFNKYHQTQKAQFYLFDSIDEQDVANGLFERGCEWAKKRGLNEINGPKGFSGFDGYGIQVEGNHLRQMMTMMNYNFPYYAKLVENAGFEKEVDFVSCYIKPSQFTIPEKVERVAARVLEKGTFQVRQFKSKKDLKNYAWKVGEAYNKTFIHNWEYYPYTEREVKFMLDNLMVIAQPELMKIMEYKDQVVGFLFAFPDISAALQRQGGRITPWGLVDMMSEIKRTNWVSVNGMGVLPEYHGLGGNALLYSEMAKSFRGSQFEHAELTQVAETAVQMRKDLINLGGEAYKNHRIYHKKI